MALDNTRPVAAALTEAGFATWNIDYRCVGHDGGGWPGTFLDVARAADFLRNLRNDYPLDLTRVIAVGHSAGGHLAPWLAARHRLPAANELFTNDPLQLAGVVDLDGPADLKAIVPAQDQICPCPAVTDLIGGTPDDKPDRHAEASPAELLPLGVRQEIFVSPAFIALTTEYRAAATQAGDELHVTALPEVGHFALIDPTSDAWHGALKRILQLVSVPQRAPK